MKDIRLEVSARVYRILLEFVHENYLKTIGIKSKETTGKHIITIYTTRPGIVIGKQGTTLKQLNDKIHEDESDKYIDIIIEELDFFIRDDNEPYSDEDLINFINDYMMARGF